MTLEARASTVSDYEAFIQQPENADCRFELIDGEIIEKMPTEEHGVIVSNLHGYIFIYLQKHKNGRLSVETRYRLPDDRHNARIPDLSFTSNERAGELVKKGAVPQMPDLAVEVQSPNQSDQHMLDKARYYLANGSRMVWLIYPDKRLIEVLTADDRALLIDGDTLSGSDLLPDFTVPVREIFPQPQ